MEEQRHNSKNYNVFRWGFWNAGLIHQSYFSVLSDRWAVVYYYWQLLWQIYLSIFLWIYYWKSLYQLKSTCSKRRGSSQKTTISRNWAQLMNTKNNEGKACFKCWNSTCWTLLAIRRWLIRWSTEKAGPYTEWGRGCTWDQSPGPRSP